MSVDKLLREIIRDEVEAMVAPLVGAIAQLQQQGQVVSQLSSLLGGGARRGPGRPPKLSLTLGRKPGRPAAKSKRGRGAAGTGCAVIGCRRPSRSKGYCAAHYQKLRMLARTKRLPTDWKDPAAPGTVKDIVLPRGRAGAKALAELRKK